MPPTNGGSRSWSPSVGTTMLRLSGSRTCEPELRVTRANENNGRRGRPYARPHRERDRDDERVIHDGAHLYRLLCAIVDARLTGPLASIVLRRVRLWRN